MPSAPRSPGQPEGELTRRFLINTVANGILRLASALAGLWAARELVRELGAVEFGLVTLSSALAGYLSFLGLGLPAGLTRQVAQYRGRGLDLRLRRLVRLAFFLFCGIGIAAAALLVLFSVSPGLRLLALAPETLGTARSVLLATAAVVLLSWPLSVFAATLAGLQKFPILNTVSAIALVGAAGISVWVARSGGGAGGVVLASGAVMIFAGVLHAAIVRREVRACPADDAIVAVPVNLRDEMRPLLSFGVWALALELAALLIYQTDQILLGVFVSVESLTAYYVVARLHNLIREANGVLGSALFPLIAEEHGRGNPAAIEQAVFRGTRYAATIVVPATLAALLLAGPFLRIWMGPSFEPLAPLAQAFASYWLVAVLASFPGQVALGMGESSILGKIAIGAALANLAVSLVLVRTWGIAGVIAGTLVAYALALPVQFAVLLPRIGIDRRRFLREVVLPVYGVMAPAGLFWWAVLRWFPRPEGPFSLAFQGIVIAGSCWISLWFIAVDRRDRARVLARLSGAEGKTA